MATTETAAIIMKGTTRTKQNLMAFRVLIPRINFVLFCCHSFIIILLSVADVSAVAITVSIDKISNHSKTNIQTVTPYLNTKNSFSSTEKTLVFNC